MKFPTSQNNQTVATVFINRQDKVTITTEKVNIVLSPAYYWFKQEHLPVKSVTQAKKLLPSIFDGSIPEGEYSYHAIKYEDSFWLFAYNDAFIAGKLKTLGIKPSQINQIYFAQSECYDLLVPLQINETHALVSDDNILSMVPLQYFKDSIPCDDYFKTHRFSKNHVSLNFFQNSLIDEKYIYRLMGVMIASIIVYFVNYLVLREDLKKVLSHQFAISEKYKLPQTSFELNGLKRTLLSKETQQINYRANIKKLLSLKLESGEYVQKLDVEEKKASYEINMNDAKRAEAIKNELQKLFQITSAKVIDTTFFVGVAL